MDVTLAEIAKKLSELAKSRNSLADCLNKINKSGITKIKYEVNNYNLNNIKICGVDGGFLKKEYHGAGIILRRAVAVCFEFEDGKLKSTNYLPNAKPVPDSIIVGPEFSESDFNLFAGLKREEIELKTAIEAIEKFSPNVLIRDGSIILYPSSVPDKNSEVHKTYKDVIELYKKLYSVCEEKNILLCGAIEDSKGKRFCSFLLNEAIPKFLQQKLDTESSEKISLNKNILSTTTDTLFLYYLLTVGERTEAINYSQSYDLPIFKDLEDYAKNIFAIYIKAAEFDRPLRIDFFSSKEKLNDTVEKISSIIYAISKQNRTYSYPSVLIEADARAKLTEVEIEHFKAAIAEKLGRNPALFELRRELRPF